MRGGVYPFAASAIDPYASGQIGWHDSDHDGIFDPVDTLPSLTIDSTARNGDTWRYAGHAVDTPYPSPLRPAATINDVSVEFSLGGSEWMPAVPADGSYDSPDELFTLTVSPSVSGNHRVAFRARNTVGNVSVATAYLVVPDPIDGGLDTWLEAPTAGLPASQGMASVRGVASSFDADGAPGVAIVRVEYRIDGGDWKPAQPQDGQFDDAEEAFTIPLDRQGGTYLVEARAIDANGKIEQNSASLEISVNYAVFIPVVHATTRP